MNIKFRLCLQLAIFLAFGALVFSGCSGSTPAATSSQSSVSSQASTSSFASSESSTASNGSAGSQASTSTSVSSESSTASNGSAGSQASTSSSPSSESSSASNGSAGSSASVSSASSITILGTQWIFLGNYTNNIQAIDAVIITNIGGNPITNFQTYVFLANKAVRTMYSNNLVFTATNFGIIATETAVTFSNNTCQLGSYYYYGTLTYSVSLSGDYLKLIRSYFTGTNYLGTQVNTNFDEPMNYLHFMKH